MMCATLAGLPLLIENERRPQRSLTLTAVMTLAIASLLKEVSA